MTLVNFNYLQHRGNDICDDPFVFASQAKKVFYVENKNKMIGLLLCVLKLEMYMMWVMSNLIA